MRFLLLLSVSVAFLGACKPAVIDVAPPALTWAVTTVHGRLVDEPVVVFPGPVSVRVSAHATDDLDAAPNVTFLDDAGRAIEPQFDVRDREATCIIEASDAAGNVTRQAVTIRIGPYTGEAVGTLIAMTDEARMSATFEGTFADRLDRKGFMAVPLDASGAPIRAPAMPATHAVCIGTEWMLTFPLDPDAAQFRIVGRGRNVTLSFTAAPKRYSASDPTTYILKSTRPPEPGPESP